MAPWCRKVLALQIAAAGLVSLTSPGAASINLPGALMIPTSAPKYCSGAFRYAARDGNSDITPLSPAQMFAIERHFARTRYAARAMQGLEPERSRVHAFTPMCGGR
jgi:hypothetical protein